MTISNSTGSGQDFQASRRSREEATFARDDGRSSRDRDGLSGRGERFHSSIFSRSADFDRALRDAGSRGGFKDGRNADDDDDAEVEPGAEQCAVLYDSRSGLFAVGSPTAQLNPDASDRTQEILKSVTAQVEASLRQDPSVLSNPLRIALPIDPAGSGLSRVEITVRGSLVSIKLCFVEQMADGVSGAQLLSAAGQLGQMLHVALPGRHIKIVQSTATIEEQSAELTEAGAALRSSAYGLSAARASR